MKITIENYRGFDIEFDTDCEKFQCIVTEDNTKESKSFSAVKKFVDDYKKDNQNFKPFYVVSNPQNRMYRKKERLKIIGVRKDGRFMAETKSGDKKQISDYDLKDYILEVETNERYFTLLEQFDAEQKEFLKEYKENVEKVYNNMQLVTLEKHKQTLIG